MDIIVKYEGKMLSLNQCYTLHWSLKSLYQKNLIKNLEWIKVNPILNSYSVEVSCNNRLDLDNNVAVVKMIIDELKKRKYLKEDNTQYFKKLTINEDLTLKKNTLIVTVKSL
jgi:hypothetical protein